jgi:lipoprotein-anchoring transpeptidase ErfK/SrfK
VSKIRSLQPSCRIAASGLLLMLPLAAGVTACGDRDPSTAPPLNATGRLEITPGGDMHRVDPNRPVKIRTRHRGDRITDVTVADGTGRQIPGRLSADGRGWRSTSPLAAGVHYTVRVSTAARDGRPGRSTVGFTTKKDGKRLRVSFGPDGGPGSSSGGGSDSRVYGVGQPVTARLSRKVKDPAARAVVESGLRVTSTPATVGSWYWVDDRTLHYRPRTYWPAHATIRVRSTLDGTRIGRDLYGGDAKPLRFTTGDQVVAVIDAGDHHMRVRRNGKLIRTLPVTTGKPGFETRNGYKVILSQEAQVRMTSGSIGIAAGSADSYDLQVQWATRVTWSGEYVHAAPWSVGSQGVANVSHGCTGMSTADAHWFYEQVRPGDVVRVINSKGHMMTPFDNGFGDWNLSWAKWQRGSALSPAGREEEQVGQPVGSAARLRPVQG